HECFFLSRYRRRRSIPSGHDTPLGGVFARPVIDCGRSSAVADDGFTCQRRVWGCLGASALLRTTVCSCPHAPALLRTAVCNCRSAFAHCGRQSAVTGRFPHLCECRSPGATLPAPGPMFPASVPVRPCTKTNVRAILRIEEDPAPCMTRSSTRASPTSHP